MRKDNSLTVILLYIFEFIVHLKIINNFIVWHYQRTASIIYWILMLLFTSAMQFFNKDKTWWMGLFRGFYIALAIFQSYHDLEARDIRSLKLKGETWVPTPDPLAPQVKSLTTPPKLLLRQNIICPQNFRMGKILHKIPNREKRKIYPHMKIFTFKVIQSIESDFNQKYGHLKSRCFTV